MNTLEFLWAAYRAVVLAILVVVAGVAGIFLAQMVAASPAEAQSPNCAPHAAVVDRLADRYGETRQSVALGNNGSVVEVFASAETGTWTMVVTTPNGLTCFIAAGVAYERVAEENFPKGDNL